MMAMIRKETETLISFCCKVNLQSSLGRRLRGKSTSDRKRFSSTSTSTTSCAASTKDVNDTNEVTTVDTVIIGTGVIGLAVARALSMTSSSSNGSLSQQREIIILDRANQFGYETSSRNSEVIHGGLYYPSNSFKAKFCVTGRKLLYDYCHSRNIYTNQCGKLIVASTQQQKQKQKQKQEEGQLQQIYNKSHANGVTDVRLLSETDVQYMEPSIIAPGGALYSPSTGIVDSHAFMQQLLADAENTGTVTVAYNSTVQDGRIRLCSNNNNNNNSIQIELLVNDMWFSCRSVINCAGLWANNIASMIHSNIVNAVNNKVESTSSYKKWIPPPLYYAKGTYYRLITTSTGATPFQHLIYPLPDNGGLGIHATIDQTGQVKFGPDVEWIDPNTTTNPDDISLIPTTTNEEQFYKSIRTYWPNLPNNSLQPDYCGIRPKLSHPSIGQGSSKVPFNDFAIITSKEHSIPGLIHLLGIESPGLTSSMAIADYVVDILRNQDNV